MNFVEAVKVCFKKYFDASGRATRSEFWYFALFVALLSFCADFVDSRIAGIDYSDWWDYGNLWFAIQILTFCPSINVYRRRLHDVNKSGWWLLISFTIVGIIFPLFYWWCKKGDEGKNSFGENPLSTSKDANF